jgi:DNA-binding CsgD family transcriptional regulator
MGKTTALREEKLHSALGRLRMPIIIFDEEQRLEPLNGRGIALFEAENLRGDLLSARPSHPLSRLIQEILRTDSAKAARRKVTFPSGKHFIVESSGKSEKGSPRWLVLLLEPVDDVPIDEDAALARWPLTDRERDVGKLLLRGLSNESIARELEISPETVKTHVRNILEKSGTHSRAELLAFVLRSLRS